MPAASQSSRSAPVMAFAVSAMIGRCPVVSHARILRVAVMPSITGICKSIKTMSNCRCWQAATAPSAPLLATSTVHPKRSRNRTAHFVD